MRGFSLVEMSVVIVIIGLLLGGTMAGMTLLRASGVKAVVAEANDFKGAMRQFETLYESVPGDMRNASSYWVGAGNGDGNRRIEGNSESALAVRHLNLAKLVSGAYTGNWGGSYVLDSNTIRSKLSPEAAIRMICCSTTDYARSLNFNNHINIFAIAIDDASQRQGVLSPIEAYGIDIKIDDGMPDAGFIGGAGGWDGTGYDDGNCYSGTGNSSVYLTTDADFKKREDSCQMMFAYDWDS